MGARGPKGSGSAPGHEPFDAGLSHEKARDCPSLAVRGRRLVRVWRGRAPANAGQPRGLSPVQGFKYTKNSHKTPKCHIRGVVRALLSARCPGATAPGRVTWEGWRREESMYEKSTFNLISFDDGADDCFRTIKRDAVRYYLSPCIDRFRST